ncbi:MAG: hypothetical protein ABI439_10260 [Rhodospirillales bacterium]
MFGKIKSWLAGKHEAPVAPDGYRTFFFGGLSVDLPANWLMTAYNNEGRWIAKSPVRKIQITISVVYFTPGTVEENCDFFARLVVQKTQTEMSLAADAVVTRPDILGDGRTLVAQYEGRQGSVRQFACKMVMRQGAVAIADVEASAEDQAWLNDVSEVVFASLASQNN